jgi:3-dehydroquinate dehydratase I
MDVPPKVVAVASSRAEAEEAVRLGADLIEVRVDLVDDDPVSLVKSLYHDLDAPLIITIRPEFEGGRFHGGDDERLRLFKELAPYAGYIDVELRAKKADDIVSVVKGTDALSIVSYHDFENTPSVDEMVEIIKRCHEKGDIAKIAVMPHDLDDVLRLYEASLKSQMPFCSISMGDVGMHSRIMACVYGSIFTYGCVGEPVAPGQMRVDKLLQGLKLLGLRS